MKPNIFLLFIVAAFSSCKTSPFASPETMPDDWSPLSSQKIKAALAGPVNFASHIKPVLAAKCVYCHKGATPASGFDMQHRASFFGSGPYGPRVLPGFPSKSLLVANISKTHEKVNAMPPVGNRVTVDEKAILRRWISQGAVWPSNVGPPQ